jgi:hypothetical protein
LTLLPEKRWSQWSDEGDAEDYLLDLKVGEKIYFNKTEVSKKDLKGKLKDVFMANDAFNRSALVKIDFDEKPTPLRLVFKTLKPIVNDGSPVKIVTAETYREDRIEENIPLVP